MSQQQTKTMAPDPEMEQTVAAYLADNPAFFERHPQLLMALTIPHPSGQAVSLLEHQVTLLRGEAARYRQQLKELIAVARVNEDLNQRLHRLTLTLMEAENLGETLSGLQDELFDHFQADAVELKLFSEHDWAQLGETADEALRDLQDLVDQERPLCGRLQRAQLDYLFGVQAAEIRSAAIVPLRADGIHGLLAIGSRDEERFHAAKGTELLSRLGETVSHTLHKVSRPGA